MAANVDARGLSCPQPVILTRTALQKLGSGEVAVVVDTMTQVQNCARAAQKLGWAANYEEQEGVFKLTLRKESSKPEQ
jgi:tRNA 2-thiouridine synthesizing protein A